MWGGEQRLYLTEKLGEGGSVTSRDLRDAPAGTEIPGSWRGQGAQSGASLSVLVPGLELAALSTRQQRCP